MLVVLAVTHWAVSRYAAGGAGSVANWQAIYASLGVEADRMQEQQNSGDSRSRMGGFLSRGYVERRCRKDRLSTEQSRQRGRVDKKISG